MAAGTNHPFPASSDPGYAGRTENAAEDILPDGTDDLINNVLNRRYRPLWGSLKRLLQVVELEIGALPDTDTPTPV